MAEIKSTMEMVLERAARMAESAPDTQNNEEYLRKGMRFGAEFMNGGGADLFATVKAEPEENQADIRKGIATTLLRNIVLPRTEELQENGNLALRGIIALSGNTGEINAICHELSQILEQYNQHKEQTTEQLNEAIKAQIQQQQMASGQELQGEINPAMHPQYQDELTKMLTSLNGQYTDALDQRKDAIMQRFTI